MRRRTAEVEVDHFKAVGRFSVGMSHPCNQLLTDRRGASWLIKIAKSRRRREDTWAKPDSPWLSNGGVHRVSATSTTTTTVHRVSAASTTTTTDTRLEWQVVAWNQTQYQPTFNAQLSVSNFLHPTSSSVSTDSAQINHSTNLLGISASMARSEVSLSA